MDPPPSQASSPAPPSAAMLAYLRGLAGPAGVRSYRDFTAAALYAPELGYYARQDHVRVGRRAASDFYTASSLGGGVFGKLICAAAANLLGVEPPRDYTLVEIGAEPGKSVFAGGSGPFAKAESRRLGDSLVPPPRAVVFANEWLDAQPFHRLVFRDGAWRELGVRIDAEPLTEVVLPELTAQVKSLMAVLPPESAEDYHLDISLDAEARLHDLAAANWRGGLILADYGHDWSTLAQERPKGTARAYYCHELSGDLLARPGKQDLTCHVCWDRLENILREQGFREVRVERQEAFFMRLAATEIEKILADESAKFSPGRQTLAELLHPAHLGHKFQVLSARRG